MVLQLSHVWRTVLGLLPKYKNDAYSCWQWITEHIINSMQRVLVRINSHSFFRSLFEEKARKVCNQNCSSHSRYVGTTEGNEGCSYVTCEVRSQFQGWSLFYEPWCTKWHIMISWNFKYMQLEYPLWNMFCEGKYLDVK